MRCCARAGSRTPITNSSAANKGRDGDRNTAVLAAAGYNFGLLLAMASAALAHLVPGALVSRFTAQMA
jgi:hypothetical protein